MRLKVMGNGVDSNLFGKIKLTSGKGSGDSSDIE